MTTINFMLDAQMLEETHRRSTYDYFIVHAFWSFLLYLIAVIYTIEFDYLFAFNIEKMHKCWKSGLGLKLLVR